MKKVAKIIRAIAFLLVLNFCLSIVSTALQYEHEMEADVTMKEFYMEKKNTSQVIVLGTSHTTMGFSPMECYKQTGITSFNLSTAAQPIEVSCYTLEEALKTQSPEVVILEAANLFYKKANVNRAKFRYTMDSMPLSWTKVKLANSFANYSEGIKIFNIGEGLCPIFYYHDRWKEMNAEEMNVFKAIPHLKGQVIRVHAKPVEFNMDKAETKYKKKVADDPNKKISISDNNIEYLEKIIKMCEDNNIKLLMTATPTVRWTHTRKKLIEDVCKEYNLDFLDLNENGASVLDPNTDMADGNHVNFLGSRKTTKAYCDYIVENYGVKGSKNEEFEENMKYYDAYWNNMIKYTTETDFNNYLTLLNENKDRLGIFIMAKGEITAGLTDKDKKQLKELGLTIDFGKAYYENSYLAVVEGGKVTYEYADYDVAQSEYTMADGTKVSLYSDGKINDSKAKMIIDGKDYAISRPGLNFVLYDKESGLVIDSVSFNTHYSQKLWDRNLDSRELELFMFKNYRYWVAENY